MRIEVDKPNSIAKQTIKKCLRDSGKIQETYLVSVSNITD